MFVSLSWKDPSKASHRWNEMLFKLAWFNLQGIPAKSKELKKKDEAQNAPLSPCQENLSNLSEEELNVWLPWSLNVHIPFHGANSVILEYPHGGAGLSTRDGAVSCLWGSWASPFRWICCRSLSTQLRLGNKSFILPEPAKILRKHLRMTIPFPEVEVQVVSLPVGSEKFWHGTAGQDLAPSLPPITHINHSAHSCSQTAPVVLLV